jgi:hypothetical protein
MLTRALLVLAGAVLLGAPAFAISTAPGDTASVVLLSADFQGDTAGAAPNVALPAPPPGDFLTLDETSGTVRVDAVVDGLTLPALIRQENAPGQVDLSAWLAPRLAGTERVTVRWRSLARDDNPVDIMACTIRAPGGGVIASVSYNPHGELTWNGPVGAGQLLPMPYQNNRNLEFTVIIDLLAQSASLAVDGVPLAGFQGVPLAAPASDVARVSFAATGQHPQSFAVDDISAVAFSRVPDRAPVVTAPATVGGVEGSPLSFSVTAADPDGEPILSLSATPLPSGALFTPAADNASGLFAWTPDFAQAGSYTVAFTAANALSGSATTEIAVSATDRVPVITAPAAIEGEEGGTLIFAVSAADPDAEPIGSLGADLSLLPPGNDATFVVDPGNASGTFTWHMLPGQGGNFPVTFTAANAVSATAYTRINVAAAGTSVTGVLVWTPQPGSEGTYDVVFTATNELNETSTATTVCTVLPALLAAPAPAPAFSRPDASGAGAIAQAPMKGPVISAPPRADAKVGTTLTVDATATSGTTLLARSFTARAATAPGAGARTAQITLTADLTVLPTGNNAVFTVDRDPIVQAPASVSTDVLTPVAFSASASDPDADAIYSFSAELGGLPSGNTATFTPNGTNDGGLFSWTPAVADSGNYLVTFTAANALVAQASTSIHVRGVAQARGFAIDKKVSLSAKKPNVCVVLEPLDGSFQPTDVILSMARLVSVGTGAVPEIAPLGKGAVIGDRDNNGIPDITLCFTKTDIRQLFSLLRGNVTVPVSLRGPLVNGRRFQADFSVVVAAGGGVAQAALRPNPLNPSGRLQFYTTRAGTVRVKVFDLNGRLVREILDEASAAPGEHEAVIDGRDGSGRPLATGVYFYRIETPEGLTAGRFTILK